MAGFIYRLNFNTAIGISSDAIAATQVFKEIQPEKVNLVLDECI
jgi:hypothetical protein